ncbi:MAG: hypothetical protein AAB436_02625 [Patescibacteria group bacterium]
MTQEIGKDLALGEQNVARAPAYTATQVSRRVQEVGQQILGSGSLLEVEEGILSTCSEPVDAFDDRLLRARDTRTPLVELTMLSNPEAYEVLRELFGANSGIVLSILMADGIERSDDLWGNNLRFQSVGLVIPDFHTIKIGDSPPDTEVDSVLTSVNYHGYDVGDEDANAHVRPSRPRFSSSYDYEHNLMMFAGNSAGMLESLDRSLVYYEAAVAREGAIESTAVEEIPEDRHLDQQS